VVVAGFVAAAGFDAAGRLGTVARFGASVPGSTVVIFTAEA